MMKVSKTKLIALLLAALLLISGLSAYLAARKIVPAMLSANIEELLSEAIGQPVSVGRSSVKVFPGMAISIYDLTAGTPAKPLVKARKVRVRISLWQALFGNIRLSSVELERPLIYLDREALKKLKLKQESGVMPAIDIQKGMIRQSGRDGRIVIEEINGTIDDDEADLEAVVLGSKTRLKASYADAKWQGTLTSQDINLARISPDLGGVFTLKLDFDFSGKKTASSLMVEGRDLLLPWSARKIGNFAVSLEAQGDENELTIKSIRARTPVVEVSGSGKISDLRKGTGASLSLDMKSGVFDYETVVRHLPTEEFETWLSLLLKTHIRGGRSRFSTAHFDGTVNQLITFENFLDHIHVVEEIMGQSYGTRPGGERIQNVTGQVVFSRGNIYLKNLHGYVRGSALERVDVSFPRIMHPFWRVGVYVRVDMAARDFLDTWIAVGMPGYVVDIFQDVSQAKTGRIRGAAAFFWNEEASMPVVAQGRVDLENCSFLWSGKPVTALSGSVISRKYGAPLEITSRMAVGSDYVRSLNVSLADPFSSMRSAYTATVDGLISTESFSMTKGTTVKIKGTGVGTNISAIADIASENMTLLGTVYRMKGKPIQGRATLKGTLAPKLSLNMKAEINGISPGRLAISGTFDEKQNKLGLKGTIPLDQFEAFVEQKAVPLSGRLQVDVGIIDAQNFSVSGNLGCRNALLPLKGSLVKLDGPVAFSGSKLSGRSLKVTKETVKLLLTSWSLDFSDKPAFIGDITMDGLTLPLAEGKGNDYTKELKSFTAKGHLKVINLDFYGIPTEEAQADASLKDGTLSLVNMIMNGPSISASGSASFGPSGLTAFESTFSLVNVSIHKLLDHFSPDPNWIRGQMSLSGRLSSQKDSMNGTVNLVAKDGKLRRYALFSRVFAVLNVYKIIQARDLELTSKNFPYNKMIASFTIKDNVIHTDDFFVDSNSLQFSVVGDYSLKTKQVDAIMGIQPFETIDRTIHAIPLLGWVFTGDDGKLLVVSLKLSGNIDDPKVMLAPVKTVSDPVKNSLLRALQLPGKIIKDTRSLLPGGKKSPSGGS